MTEIRQLEALHGLRGLAALTVVVGHARGFADLPIPASAPAMGVMLFFALSGFLMTYIYVDMRPSKVAVSTFLVNRFARVWPLFAVVCVFMALANLAGIGLSVYNMSLDRLMWHLFGLGDSPTIWTISTEFQFYLAFAVIWLVFGMTGQKTWTLVAFLIGASALLCMTGFPGGRIGLTAYFQVFAVGMVGALAYRHLALANGIWRSGAFLALLLGGFAVAFLFAPRMFGSARYVYEQMPLIALSGLLVLVAVTAEKSLPGRILSSRVMRWAGDLSFGIYLLHRTVILLLGKVLPDGMHWSLRFLLVLIGTCAIAYVAFVLIERPARTFIRSKWAGSSWSIERGEVVIASPSTGQTP